MKNNTLSFEEKTNKIIFWGVCFILVLPVIVLPFSFQPSDWTRAILLRISLTILVCFILFKFLNKKEISISIPKWKNPVYLPFLILAAFFITLILATIFSEDIRFSIFSSPTRAGGLITLLFYFIFAVFLALFVKENDWEKLWKLTFSVGILASLIAIVQYFNLSGGFFIAYTGSPPSLLGNSTFLAIYMLFLVFLSFTLFIRAKNRKEKIAYAGLFCLFILTILITGSRATYLATLIGFSYFFFLYPSHGVYSKRLKMAKIIVIALLFFASLVVVYANISPKFPNFVENNVNLSYFIHNRLSVKIVSRDLFGTRLSVWQIAIQMIKEKPFLGWGPENFYVGFEKYYEPVAGNLQRLWWDRPHNIFLDVATNTGIISLLFYVAFWIVLLWELQKFKKRTTDHQKIYLAHGLQTMFIGYLIVLFFNFDSFSTYLISFFFIGYSFFLISQQEEKTTVYPPKTLFFQKKPAIITFLIVIAVFLWFWNIKPLYLNENIRRAQNLISMKKCDQALAIVENSWKKGGILRAYSGLRYIDFIKKCAPVKPEKELEYSKKALEVLKTSADIQPKFSRTWLFMGSFTNVLASREEDVQERDKLLIEARDYLKKALNLSPKRQEIFVEIEKSYLVDQDYQAMRESAKDCINADPMQGECYWYLGIAEIFLGDQINGKKHIQESLSAEKWSFVPHYMQLGAAYISQKNYEDAADAYYLAVINNQENASYHAVLAALYKQIGKYAEASQQALAVFKLQPDSQDSIDFIQALLGLNPNDPVIHGSMAYVYQQMGQEEKAKQELLIARNLYLQLIVRYPNVADYHYNLAITYRELQDYENANKEVLLSMKIDPNLRERVASFLQTLPDEFWLDYVNQAR